MKLNPRAQLRRDLNTGKVKQQPRSADDKLDQRAAQVALAVSDTLKGTGWQVLTSGRAGHMLNLTIVHEDKRLRSEGALNIRTEPTALAHWLYRLKQQLLDAESAQGTEALGKED